MIKTKIGIFVQSASINLDDRVVMLGKSIIKKWKIPTEHTVTLRYGSAKNEVKVVSVEHLKGLRISPKLAGSLGLHNGVQLCLQYKPSTRTLIIGPLIGVMVTRVYASSTDRPFSTNTAFCREMTEACRQYGAFVYFFPPDDMHASPSSVNGWSYAEGWSKKAFPVPNVLYNRLTSRVKENLANVQHFMRDAKAQHGTQIFNERYLNKTEVFEALKKDNSLHIYLPESYLFKNYQMLKSMSSRHPVLFLKPIMGSLGKGIIRIRREPNGSYTCHFTNVNGSRKQSFSSLSELFSRISGKLKTQRFQLQQGLQLIEAGERPVDFRALVQRNAQGDWGITSIVGRIAGNQHFVSNLARGGSLSTVKEALAKSSLSAQQAASTSAKLRKSALDIAKGIETQIPSHFGELGIDLAVDIHGKVWLLEVNSKPSKEENSPLSTELKIRPSVKQIIQYAKYIAKF